MINSSLHLSKLKKNETMMILSPRVAEYFINIQA